MLKNLPLIALILVVLYVLYSSQLANTLKTAVADLTGLDTAPATTEDGTFDQELDLGMYDSYNPNAFGTTLEGDRRITNDGVRKEYHHNPFPWSECTCASGNCDKHGVPEPTPGQTHVCKNGFPSKRIVDMHGGHFQLNHICSGTPANECSGEPAVLGRWFQRCGCSNAESIGLGIRPACTRCG